VREKFSYSDDRIGFIKKYADALWKGCFGTDIDYT